MNFYTQRRTVPVVPIVSLIDILAILLIFFITTMTFEEKKPLLNINLPKASNLSGASSAERRLTISVGEDETVYVGDREVPLDQLAVTLKALKARQPDVKLELKADEALPLGTLVGVWDAFNQAGIAIKDVPARILLQSGATP